jgi:alpha-glucosidase (family GH31 glycosyl hydrolase)
VPAWALEEQVLVGESLLVRVIHRPLQEADTALVHLPPGGWYDLRNWDKYYPAGTGQQLEVKLDLESIPVFVKGGSILPLRLRARKSLGGGQWVDDPLTLRVWLDPPTSTARGDLYLDDGETRDYLSG